MARLRPRGLAILAGLSILAIVVFAAAGWKPRRFGAYVYRIGINSNPPYQILNADGSVSGLYVDLINAAARQAGVRLQWIQHPEGPDGALQRGVVDLWPV